MNELYDSIKYLCDSPLRLRILNVLDSTQMDLRSLKTELENSRTSLQRNLSELEQRGWIKETQSGYTATTVGTFILTEIMVMEERIETINTVAPFLEAVDTPSDIDIGQLTDAHVTVPEPTRPNVPMKRLLDAFDGSDRVRGILPVVSWLFVELSRGRKEVTTIHEYLISQDALSTLQKQYAAEPGDSPEMNQPTRIDIHIYEDDLSYGLFLTEDTLILAAYNEINRLQALIESKSESAIKWGEQVYETYRHQSYRPTETNVLALLPNAGRPD